MSDVMKIPLSQGLFALVDAADYEWLTQWKWSASKQGKPGFPPKFRAFRMTWNPATKTKKGHLMHRAIVGAKPGQVVDHINGDPLDNRRENLRVCNNAQNSMNSDGHRDRGQSRFKGVARHNNKWTARLKSKYLGIFENEEDAARAYDMAARKYSPEYARLNFPSNGG